MTKNFLLSTQYTWKERLEELSKQAEKLMEVSKRANLSEEEIKEKMVDVLTEAYNIGHCDGFSDCENEMREDRLAEVS